MRADHLLQVAVHVDEAVHALARARLDREPLALAHARSDLSAELNGLGVRLVARGEPLGPLTDLRHNKPDNFSRGGGGGLIELSGTHPIS